MRKIGSILRLDFLPTNLDLGLLVLRLWIGISMLTLHGWGKLTGFKKMSGSFADPLKIGSEASLTLAVFGEVICSVLLVIGLFTRFAALSGVITMAVAFFLVNKMVLKGGGELAFVYMCGYVVILLVGPGGFSLDGKGSKGFKKSKPGRD